MANTGLANFETKTSAESKTEFVLRLFAVTKQDKCKTTIKTIIKTAVWMENNILSIISAFFCLLYCMLETDQMNSKYC